MASCTDHGATTKLRRRWPQLWRRVVMHSALCFVMGFFTGFASSPASDWNASHDGRPASAHVVRSLHAVSAVKGNHLVQGAGSESPARPLLLVVTTTDQALAAERQAAGLTRTAHALRLVPPPVLWIVVEAEEAAPLTAPLLRGTRMAYRHLTYDENFTDAGEERHYQRNVALWHVEDHRLAGIVIFAGLGDVQDLRFFKQLREISCCGVWAVAKVSGKAKKVAVEGPACSSSKVTGWFSNNVAAPSKPREIDVHGFAFNSSMLWDPERWAHIPTSQPDTSQDSMKFAQRMVSEDHRNLRGIPWDCSEIMVWRLVDTPSVPSSVPPPNGKSLR